MFWFVSNVIFNYVVWSCFILLVVLKKYFIYENYLLDNFFGYIIDVRKGLKKYVMD